VRCCPARTNRWNLQSARVLVTRALQLDQLLIAYMALNAKATPVLEFLEKSEPKLASAQACSDACKAAQ
jgi:hypothetical protein